MGVNNSDLGLTWQQSANLMNAIVEQATGQTVLDEINIGDYTSVYTTAMRCGYDPLLHAIGQVLSKTIFSIRPYSRKLKSLEVTAERWGAITRKLQIADKPVKNDERMTLVDGETYSPYKVSNPRVIETNIAGANQYEDYITIYRDQLDSAFTGMEQFNSFLAMVIQNMTDKLEQYRENESRACLVNLIGSTIACEDINGARGRVHYLFDEYKTFAGLTSVPTWDDIRGDKDKMISFAQFLFSTIKTDVRRLGERSVMYHECPMDAQGDPYPLMRHTSPDNMTAYFLAEFFDQIDAFVLNGQGMFHTDKLMTPIDYEGVTYWQSLKTPGKIDAKIQYYNVEDSGVAEVVVNDTTKYSGQILGVIFDKDACGMRVMSEWQADSGMNPRNGANTRWYHMRTQWSVDNTENCIVYVLGSKPVGEDEETEPR